MTQQSTFELKARPVDYERAKEVMTAIAAEDGVAFDRAIDSILDDPESTPYDSGRAVIGILAAVLIDPSLDSSD